MLYREQTLDSRLRGEVWYLANYARISILVHHGIKGQKWGVRNGPPYPLDNAGRNNKIVLDAIKSGKVSARLNREKQLRHTYSYHAKGKSYLKGDLDYAQELFNKHFGKGTPVIGMNGRWVQKERFTDDDVIGTYTSKQGLRHKTNKGVIVYSKTGSHIYPRKDEDG